MSSGKSMLAKINTGESYCT